MKRIAALFCVALLAGCPDGGSMMSGTGPKLTSTRPTAMEKNVALTTPLTFTFSDAMAVDSVTVTLAPTTPLGELAWDEEKKVLTVLPVNPLQPSTEYTVRVAGNDATGRKLTGDTAFAFTTANPAETTPPSLQSSSPANNATMVVTSSSLSLTFSEPMDQSSVQLATTPEFDWGPGTWSSDGATLLFSSPPSSLAADTQYVIALSGADLANNQLPATVITFRTSTGMDTTPPMVMSTSPAPNATGVPPSVSPSVTFSEPMQPGSTAAFSLSPGGCTAVLDASGTILSCDPTTPLMLSTPYTVTVAGNLARDLAGNPMGTTYSFSFTTGAVNDTTAPTIVSMVPSDGGFGVTRTAPMTVIFSEPMDQVSTQAALSVGMPAGKQLLFVWNDGGTGVQMRVDGGFDYGDQVAWNVATSAKDLAGNPLAAGGVGSYRVVRLCTARFPADQEAYAIRRVNIGGTSYAMSARTVGTILTGKGSPSGRETVTYRALAAFDFSGGGTGCVAKGFGTDAQALVSARLVATQSAVTGTPYGTAPVGMRPPGHVDAEPVLVGPTADAGAAMFAPCPSGRTCDSSILFSSSSVQTRSLDVTAWAKQFRESYYNRNNDHFQLRLVNDYAETQTGPDYSSITDGNVATDAGLHLDVTYEYP